MIILLVKERKRREKRKEKRKKKKEKRKKRVEEIQEIEYHKSASVSRGATIKAEVRKTKIHFSSFFLLILFP